MHAALLSGARVIALHARLIVFRVNECTPRGLLTALAHWDLVPIRDQPDLVRDVVLDAIKPGRHKGNGLTSAQYWRATRTMLHPEVKSTPSFSGRISQLGEIDNALRSGETAAVHGLGGVGKSTLAREYAHQAQDGCAGVWWLNAARAKDSKSWEGLEKGLVDLGKIFIRGLDHVQDRAAAARQTLEFIANGGFTKPWLLIYDNVDDPAVLRQWPPVGNARVLMTSRLGAWGAGVAKIKVDEWAMPEAVAYLLKDSGRNDLTVVNAEAIATALGRLPLALSHAAAYLRENENAIADSYLAAIAQHMREAPESAEYDRAVFATFHEQVEQVEARVPGARAVISLAAFYAPEGIPEELFSQAAEQYPAALAQIASSPVKLEKAIGALARFSLIDFNVQMRAFSVHQLVQAAARDALANEVSQWAQSALVAAYAAFPLPRFDTWPVCERLTPHVRAVASQVTEDSGELAWLLGVAGSYLEARTAIADVLPLYERSLAVFDRLTTAEPGNVDWQRDLAVTHSKIGGVLFEQGNLPAALDRYKAALAIRDRLATAEPGNLEWQHYLAISHVGIGDVLVQQGDLPSAFDSYKACYAIFDRLTSAQPQNADWQHDLAMVGFKVGDMLQASGNFPAALECYEASFADFDRLATLDPANLSWQRDLALSHDRVGDMLAEQNRLVGALKRHEASLAIRSRLATADPENADWQRDLSISHNKVGDLLFEQGNLRAALNSWKASLAIADRLATADPRNAGRQRDVAILNERIGDMHARRGQKREAIAAFERALGIFRTLLANNPDDVQARVLSVVPLWRLGGLKAKDGRKHLEEALAILKSLLKADRLDARRRHWIPQIEAQIAALNG